jgi:hypothetical protein
MAKVARELNDLPLIPRCMVIGSLSLGIIGAVLALIGGIAEYAPTAWFAFFEGGVLAAVAGAMLGLLAGVAASLLMTVARRVARRNG